MRPVTFIHSDDDIYRGVKQESSLFAIRQNGDDGNPLFESLVFDEAYYMKFKELFYEAQSEVTQIFSAYLKFEEVDYSYFEPQNVTNPNNIKYAVTLEMPDTFVVQMVKPIDSKIREFFIAYICYRWLETKIPTAAKEYYGRAEECKDRIRSMLEHRTKKRIKGRWF